MNYYEQFYDDLELMDYEEERYRRGYHGYKDSCYDDPYRGQGYDPPRSHDYYDDYDSYRGQRLQYDDEYNEDERAMFERDRSRPPYDRGRGHSNRSLGAVERGHRGNQRGRGYIDRGRGHVERERAQGDRGRGQGDLGQVRGCGRARGGHPPPSRGARGKTHMTFVKAGVLKPASKDAENENNEGGESSGSNVTSDTLRFDYKTYAAQKTPSEKEVEEALRVYSCTLGFGYGYGPRSDLIDGGVEGPTWMGLAGDTQGEGGEGVEPAVPAVAAEGTSPTAQTADLQSPEIQQPLATVSQPETVVKKAMVNPKFSFVKANAEFHSIDVAFHEIPVIKPKENSLSVNMGNKRLGLGFGMSAQGSNAESSVNVSSKFHAGMKDGTNPKFDQKFEQLHESVKQRNVAGKNGIEVLHMAAQKVKMSLTDDIRTGGRTPTGQPMFTCRLEIDGVYVAEGHATAKKMAKHQAFANGVKLLLNDNLTVKEVSQGVFELKQKDSEFKMSISPAAKPTLNKVVAQRFIQGQFANTGVSSMTTASSTVTSSSQATTQEKSSAPPTITYTKPKIVFHKSSHPLSDKPLDFKTLDASLGSMNEAQSQPESSNSRMNTAVKNPAAMAMKLLNFVKEGEEGVSNDHKVKPIASFKAADDWNVNKSKQTSVPTPNWPQAGSQHGSPQQGSPQHGPNKVKSEQSNKVAGPMLVGPSKAGRLSSTECMVQSAHQVANKRRLDRSGGQEGQGRLKVRKKEITHSLEDLSQFIIIDNTNIEINQTLKASSILHNSGNFNRVVLKVEYEPCADGTNCCYVVGDHYMSAAFGVNKEEAKQNAAVATLEELREMCYTIKVKQQVDSDGASLSKEELMSDIQRGGEMLPDSNIGNMLLRKMGWEGGGVGRSGQGIAEPVKAEMMIGREGLGLKAARGLGREFNKKVVNLLENYIKSDDQQDLYFSSELSKEERAIIHTTGQKMGLKTQSKGKGDNRYLIVSRKRSAQELLDHVISSGGTTSKYEVLPPASGDHSDCRKKEDINFGHCKQ